MRSLLGADGFALVLELSLEAMLADIRDDLSAFGVEFERWYSERELARSGAVEHAVAKLESRGQLYRKDGALWFRASQFGDDEDRVLVRANGQPTYFAPDIAYHLQKRERGYAHLIDVLGADHHGYVARVRGALLAMGEPDDCLEACLIQFVSLFRGGEKIPMGKREAQFVTLRQLREEVGNDACRLFYLMRSHDQHLDFDLELAKSRSNENPVYYLQYAHARIASVRRQLENRGLSFDRAQALQMPVAPRVAVRAGGAVGAGALPGSAAAGGRRARTARLVHFLRELATAFHGWYNAAPFIVEDAGSAQRAAGARVRRAAGAGQRPDAAGRVGTGEHVSGQRLTSRDYKKPAAASSGFDLLRWRDFGLGLAIGLGVRRRSLCGRSSRHRGQPARAAAGAAPQRRNRDRPRASDVAAADASGGEPAAQTEGNYDFYHMLPKFEVVVPEKERGSRVAPASPIDRPGVYFLQAGSYRDEAVAERIRAQLAKLGIDASVQRVAVDADVWHRVRIGPDQGSGPPQPPAQSAAAEQSRRAGGARRRLSGRR